MEEKKDIFWRAYLIYFGFVVVMIIVFSKTLIIQLEGSENVFLASNNGTDIMPTRTVEKESRRGEILDANLIPLVTSVSFYDIHMDPTVVPQEIFDKELAGLCKGLNKIYPSKSIRQYEELIRKGRAKGSKYLLIHKKASNEERKKIRKLPIFKEGRLKGGLIDNNETIIRKRPHGELMKRTLGYVKTEESGKNYFVGLEGAYNDELQGVPGEEIEQKFVNGWKKIGQVTKEAVEGADIITTFDIEIQDVAHSELMNQLQKQGAKNGSVIVMDVKTGHVKAMVNLSRNSDGKYYESFNTSIAGRQVPGSTFKLASLMAGLEDKKFRITDSVNATGKYTYYGHSLNDSRSYGYGRITVQHAFEKSSNVISKLINDSYKSRPQDFVNRLKSFGLDKPLGIEIEGEKAPILPEPGTEGWSRISLPWLSIGYEVEQTPLQTLTFYNAVANNGKMMKPMFVKQIRRDDKIIHNYNPQVLNPKLCSQNTINSLKKCLEGVMTDGTGVGLKSKYFSFACKTGTAVIKNAKNKNDRVYQASFVGYFPAENPIYSCIVVVSAPTEDIYGAIVSGTVFRAIAHKVYATSLQYHTPINSKPKLKNNIPTSSNGNIHDLTKVYNSFGIPFESSTDKEWVIPMKNKSNVTINERYIGVKTVPNVNGMTAKDAVYLIESTGMTAKIIGNGKVIKQSIAAGTKVFVGGVVNLVLK